MTFKAAFDKFINDKEALKKAILEAKKNEFGSNVELFEDGTFQVSFNTWHGPYCINEGIIMYINQETVEDYDIDNDTDLDNFIEELKDEYESVAIEYDEATLEAEIDEHQGTFNSFISNTELLEDAILKSTQAWVKGSGYSLLIGVPVLEGYEILPTDSLKDMDTGNPLIINIPPLLEDEYDETGKPCFENAVDILKESFEQALCTLLEKYGITEYRNSWGVYSMVI